MERIAAGQMRSMSNHNIHDIRVNEMQWDSGYFLYSGIGASTGLKTACVKSQTKIVRG